MFDCSDMRRDLFVAHCAEMNGILCVRIVMALCSDMCGIVFRTLICAMRSTCIAALRFAWGFVPGTLDVPLWSGFFLCVQISAAL